MCWTKVTMVRLKSLIGFLLRSHDQTENMFFHLTLYFLLTFCLNICFNICLNFCLDIRSPWTIASSIRPALQLQKGLNSMSIYAPWIFSTFARAHVYTHISIYLSLSLYLSLSPTTYNLCAYMCLCVWGKTFCSWLKWSAYTVAGEWVLCCGDGLQVRAGET